jgi:glycosyltransferase involved in cell wall biosynthesis
VLEAFADGVPVIVSDTPALTELVEAGQTGLHFAAEAPASLSAALDQLARMSADARNRMGENGRALYRARFTAERMVSAYEGFYRPLIDSGFQVPGSGRGEATTSPA